MKKFVSIGSTGSSGRPDRRHYVVVTEGGRQQRHGPFPNHDEASRFASAECDRLGIGPAYVGVRCRA